MAVKIAFVLLLVSFVCAEDISLDAKAAPITPQQISKTCFGCICEAASGCDTQSGCLGDVCGPFRITWGYWSDSGKPTLNNESADAQGAWTRCVNDPFCAADSVQGYMNKFAQDCNGDGTINCDDYARIHYLGGYGCSGPLPFKYDNAYKTCISHFQPQF